MVGADGAWFLCLPKKKTEQTKEQAYTHDPSSNPQAGSWARLWCSPISGSIGRGGGGDLGGQISVRTRAP